MDKIEILKNKIEQIVDESSSSQWIDKLPSLFENALDADRCYLFRGEEITALFGEECHNIIPRYFECDKNDSETEIIDFVSSDSGWDISSVLILPLLDPSRNSDKCFGVLLFVGRKEHEYIEEEIVPLKSGSKTIGVTVKKNKKIKADRNFDDSDLQLLLQSIEYLFEIQYSPTEESLPEHAPKESEKPPSEEKKEESGGGILKKIKQFIMKK